MEPKIQYKWKKYRVNSRKVDTGRKRITGFCLGEEGCTTATERERTLERVTVSDRTLTISQVDGYFSGYYTKILFRTSKPLYTMIYETGYPPKNERADIYFQIYDRAYITTLDQMQIGKDYYTHDSGIVSHVTDKKENVYMPEFTEINYDIGNINDLSKIDQSMYGNYAFKIRRISKNVFLHSRIHLVPVKEEVFSKGSYIEDVTSSVKGMYPSNSKSGDYWYEYVGEEVSQTIADQYNSPTKSITINYNKTYNIEDGIADKQPRATVVEVGGPVDTKTSGGKTAKAKITFSDKSTKIVDVKIHVNPSKAENFTDNNKDNKKIHIDSKTPIEVVKDKQPDLSKIVKEINDKDKNPDVKNVTTPDADTSNTGDGTAKVVVEFNDGSKTEIDVPIKIIDTDAAKFAPELKTIIAIKGENLAENVYKDVITNLPSDLKEFKVVTPLDTSNLDNTTAKVSLKFKDNSTKEVTLNARVLEVPKAKTVDWGKKLELTKGIVGLSDKDKVEDTTSPAINTKESGNKTGKIKVTLESGETREFEIKVKVNKSESETNTNIGSKQVTVPWGEVFDIKQGITNLPNSGESVKDISTNKVNTKQSGNYIAKAEVTFADGSTKTVDNILVIVSKSEAENFTEQVIKEEIKRGGTINLLDNITNLPKGASVKDITDSAIDTKEVGTFTGKVEITFSDGSTKQVEIPVEISKLAAEEFTPVVNKEEVAWGKTVDLTDNITNLPERAKVEDITNPAIDTTKSGEYKGKVRVTFTDKSTKEVEIPVKVKKSDSENFIPKVNTEEVIKGQPVNLLDNIENLPNGASVKDITNPAIDINKPGTYTGKVEVTFKDGSKQEVDIAVKVVLTAGMITPVPTIDKENILPEIVDWNKPIDLTDNINNLPDGATVKDVTKPAIDITKSGEYVGKVEITFKDGSKRIVEIPVTVNKSESENFKPIVLPEEVIKGNPIDLTDNVKNLPDGATVKDISNPAIDINKTGKQTAKVEITFPDGSIKQVEIPVKVVINAGLITPVPTIDPSNIIKETVEWGKPIDLTDNIKNLPEGARVEDITSPAIDTTKSGDYTGKVEITFKDNSKRRVEIPVTVNKSQSESVKSKILPEEIIKGNPIDLTDNITNLPEGTQVKDITNPAIDTTKPGTYTGKVEITFPDGSKKEIEIPVKVVLTAGMIVPVPEITKENILPEVVGWGKAIDLTDNIRNLPDGATIRDITSPVIDTKQAGTYTAKAEVAFKDGSKRVVNIPVTVNKSEAETFVPNVKYVTVKRTRPYKLTDSITNIPGNAEVKINQQIDVSKIGDQNEIITITFSDGSIRQLNMPVEVVPLESDGFIAQTETIVVDWGKPLNPSKGIKNLPDGATVVEITDPKVDTKVSGNKNAEAKIIFSDESIKEVTIPVTVNKSESENFANKFNKETDIIPEEVIKGNSIDLSDNIKNLPNNVTVENITDPAIDTNNPGKYIATAKVIFSDGSTMTVEIPVKVVIKAGMITPVPSVGKSDIEDENVNWSGEIDLTDNVKNLPDGATVKDITEPKIDTTKPGEYTGKVEITFPDGSKRTVEVPIIVDKSQAEKYEENPKIEEEKVARNGKVDLTDNIKDLPEGTKVVDTTKDKIDTSKLGTSTGTVEVTFPDGSKQEFEVPIKVYKTEAEAFENPIITREVVKKGENVDLTDNVVNLPEGAKVVDTTEPAIDTNKVGEYTAKAKIVFKDGSEKEIEVEVVVTDGKINHNDNNGDGYTSGVIGNDTTGSCNGPTNFNVKSDGYTPEYKTKSDENNQESKHKTLDNLLNNLSNLGKRNDIKSNENTTKYVFKIGEKSYKTIHGDNVTSHKMDVAPYIKNDRTMMPLRYVAEAIGADVQWDNSTRTAIFEKDGLVAKIQIDGNKIVMSNGQVYEMDAKPDNINDRILVSITNVSKVFNLTNGHTKDGVNQNIEWNNDNRTVTIVK